MNHTTSMSRPPVTVVVRPGGVFDTVTDLAPYRQQWLVRCQRYAMLRSYYRGTFYSDWAEMRQQLKLYAGIKQIFGPLRRTVRVDVAKVPGGWALAEDVPPAVALAVQQLREWSNARASYSRAVQHGAVAGEFALMVVDDQRARRVEIVPLRPDEVVLGQLSSGEPFGLVIKQNLFDRQGQYEYAQLITPATITTFRNGRQHDYDGAGSKRRNLQGRIPIVFSPYIAGEDGLGECAFSGAYELLDRINDTASQALDVVQRNAEPLVVISGVDDVEMDEENNALVLSKADAKAYALPSELAINEALELIKLMLSEFKNVLPQLILDKLESRNDLAYDTVLALLGEFIDHIYDVRTHVDMAVETAERMALEAMQMMNLTSGLDVAAHRLDADRPVIRPTRAQQLALEAQELSIEGARLALSGNEGRQARR